MKIEINWKQLVAGILLAAFIVFGASDRGRSGSDAVANLNGTWVFFNTLTDTAGSTPTELYIEPGANVFVECTNAGFVLNIRAADANATTAKMVSCAAGQQLALGFLTVNDDTVTAHTGGGYLSYESASGTGSIKVFRVR